MSGWVSFFAGFSAPIAAAALAFSDYLGYFFPALKQANASLVIGSGNVLTGGAAGVLTENINGALGIYRGVMSGAGGLVVSGDNLLSGSGCALVNSGAAHEHPALAGGGRRNVARWRAIL